MSNVADKCLAFRQLHESGCFVIPNPWDVGSARYLESLGFPALATTSGGAAWSLGYADGQVPRDTMLEHIAALVAATDLPVNADFESGFGEDHDALAESVRLRRDGRRRALHRGLHEDRRRPHLRLRRGGRAGARGTAGYR